MSAEPVAEVLAEDEPLPFWDHVGELRARLVNSALALFAATTACYFLRFRLWELAKRPLLRAISVRAAASAFAREAGSVRGGLGNDVAAVPPLLLQPFAYTDLAEPFFSMLRLSFWASVFLIAPYLFYQTWAFVRPALRERERRMAVTFVAATSACFIAGAVFAYFSAFPILADLLMDEAVRAGLRPNLRPNEYLDLFLYTVLGTGISFEAPVLFYFLGRFGLVSSRAMLKHWRESTVAILAASAFLTPGDVIATTILFGVVLLGLYFVSAGVVRLVEGRY